MLIASFENINGIETDVHRIDNHYTIVKNGILVQKDLTSDEFVRWSCNALHNLYYLISNCNLR